MIQLNTDRHWLFADVNFEISVLDDAWARPYRERQFGVEYPTHPFRDEDGKETSTVEILEACESALVEWGWLIADADDWLLPRILSYLTNEWGDVTEDYSGGGYRKVGGVTNDEPNSSLITFRTRRMPPPKTGSKRSPLTGIS